MIDATSLALLLLVGVNTTSTTGEAQLGENTLGKGDYKTAIVQLKNNLRFKTKYLSPTHSDVALAHLGLAIAYSKSGQYEKVLADVTF